MVPSSCVLPGQRERVQAQTCTGNPRPDRRQHQSLGPAWSLPQGYSTKNKLRGEARAKLGGNTRLNHSRRRLKRVRLLNSTGVTKNLTDHEEEGRPCIPTGCGLRRPSRPHVLPLSICAEATELLSSPEGRGREVGDSGGVQGAHHQEGVADPEAPPGAWTRGYGLVLAVHGHRLGGGLAHGAAADVRPDVLLRQRHHGQGRGAGQPVGPVVPLGVVAHLVDVAVGEGQSAKHGEARPRQTLGREKRRTWRVSSLSRRAQRASRVCRLRTRTLQTHALE